MTGLAAVSDEDLIASLPRGVRSNNPLNLKDTAGQFRSFPTMDEGVAAADQNLLAYKTRHGIDTINGVVGRWAPAGADGNDPAAYAAHVSRVTGIAPDARIDLADANTRHALLSAMGEHENGAPVVPAQKADLSGVSDAELLASLGKVAAKAPGATASARKPVAAPTNPTIAQDAASGFAQPFVNLGHDVMQNLRAHGSPHLPTSLSDVGESLAGPARIVGDVLGLPGALAGAAVRPAARAINRALPGPTVAPQLTMVGGKPVLSAPRQLQGDEAQGAVETALNTALAGARPAVKAPVLTAPAPMNLDEVKAASDAAWRKVDASGFRFPKADVQSVAADIAKTVADEGGRELYPAADAISKRVSGLADQGDLSVAQLNRLRSQVGEKLLQPGSTEASIGSAIRDKLDGLIDTAQNPALSDARDLYARYKKMQEVANRTDSAELRASSTYAGGNRANATRQNLRPLIDPKSPQRIRNLTPDETRALNGVVRGTPAQNAIRTAGKVLDPRGLLGAIIQTMFGIPTHGLSTATAPVGMAASAASNKMTAGAVQDLLNLISTGGNVPKAPPFYPTLALGGRPALPILSPAGLIGGTEVATLPARLRALEASEGTKKRVSAKAR